MRPPPAGRHQTARQLSLADDILISSRRLRLTWSANLRAGTGCPQVAKALAGQVVHMTLTDVEDASSGSYLVQHGTQSEDICRLIKLRQLLNMDHTESFQQLHGIARASSAYFEPDQLLSTLQTTDEACCIACNTHGPMLLPSDSSVADNILSNKFKEVALVFGFI
ncbi:hypothetical protein ABBQ38_014321 [Trebouxia sp. C0009 RCD-2024]